MSSAYNANCVLGMSGIQSVKRIVDRTAPCSNCSIGIANKVKYAEQVVRT